MCDGMADDITHYDLIEGYCSSLSHSAGDTVELCVSTSAPRYRVRVERWGAERQTVWESDPLPGAVQHTPADADAHGCGWAASVRVPTHSGWPSGFYLVTLLAEADDPVRNTSYACFVVRGGAERADALLVLATNTWNAYNNWGGRSLYTGGHQVSFRRPFGRGMLVRPHTERDDRKARPRYRGEQPDSDGEVYQRYRFEHGYPGYMASAGWFTYERRFVEWAEATGITLDYAVSDDLASVDGLTASSQLVLGVGHDEYWSADQRAAIERHIAGGGDYVSMSGNTMFWQVRLTDDRSSMVCHKYAAHRDDPVVGTPEQATMTGMWADPLVGRPESLLLGGGSMFGLYSRFGQATPRGVAGFVVYRDDHWLLAGTGLRYGDVLGADDGVVGYETVGSAVAWDERNLPVVREGAPVPADTEVIAVTPASNLAMGEYPASIAALDDQGDLEFVAERIYGGLDADSLAKARHGNAVILCCRPAGSSGGQVTTIGSTDWVFGLATDPLVQAVTRNALRGP